MAKSIPRKNGRKSEPPPEISDTRPMTAEERVIDTLRRSLAGIHEEIEHGYVVDPERIKFLEEGLRDLEEQQASRLRIRSGFVG